MSSVERLLRYDPANRNLKTRDIVDDAPIASDFKEVFRSVVELASVICNGRESQLSHEINEWSRFRAVFVLIPEQLIFGPDTIEQKPLIVEHLTKLGIVNPSPHLVSAIKCLCGNIRNKRSGSRKLGITDIYIKYPHIFKKLLSDQADRCCYCGIQLQYGENATLDHLWPFFLGGDPHDGSNWCLCCNECNNGKGEYPFYSLTVACVNWIGPNAELKLSSSTRFAALVRTRACKGCGRGPKEVRIEVVKRLDSGCWILDNVETVCEEYPTCSS